MIERLSIVFFVFALRTAATCGAAEPIPIGSHREPLVDDYLIDTMTGAKLTLHQPAFREVVFLEYIGAPVEELYTRNFLIRRRCLA